MLGCFFLRGSNFVLTPQLKATLCNKGAAHSPLKLHSQLVSASHRVSLKASSPQPCLTLVVELFGWLLVPGGDQTAFYSLLAASVWCGHIWSLLDCVLVLNKIVCSGFSLYVNVFFDAEREQLW